MPEFVQVENLVSIPSHQQNLRALAGYWPALYQGIDIIRWIDRQQERSKRGRFGSAAQGNVQAKVDVPALVYMKIVECDVVFSDDFQRQAAHVFIGSQSAAG